MECTASFGELRRMTQFKDKSEGQESARAGLFTYPCLMAADILLYDTDRVPVGDDQRQHLELTRDLAIRWNNRYGDTFVVPEAAIPRSAARVMDLQRPTAKMSKSRRPTRARIDVFEDPAAIVRKIKRAVTDTDGEVRYDPAAKPGVSNLLELLAVATASTPQEVAERYTQYGPLKADTADAVVEILRPLQERFAALEADPGDVREVLAKGAAKAAAVAEPVLAAGARGRRPDGAGEAGPGQARPPLPGPGASPAPALGSPLYDALLARAADDVEAGGPIWKRDRADRRAARRRRRRRCASWAPPTGWRSSGRPRRSPPTTPPAAATATPTRRGRRWSALAEGRPGTAAWLGRPHAGVQTNEVGRAAALLGGFLASPGPPGWRCGCSRSGPAPGCKLRWGSSATATLGARPTPPSTSGEPWVGEHRPDLTPAAVAIAERTRVRHRADRPHLARRPPDTAVVRVARHARALRGCSTAACRVAAGVPAAVDTASADDVDAPTRLDRRRRAWRRSCSTRCSSST